jgi:hypothetical protein
MVTLEVLELPLGTDLLLASRRETPESAKSITVFILFTRNMNCFEKNVIFQR